MKRHVIRHKAVEPKSAVNNDPDPKDGGVQSVDRALLIIETLAEDDEGYRLTDLAIRTGLSPSTVHRLLATLEKRRFIHSTAVSLPGIFGRKASLSARHSFGAAIS